MKNWTVKQLSAAAMMTAVSVVLLYLAQVAPTMKLSLTALSGVAAALLIARHGPMSGILCYGASSVLGLFLTPGSAWLYVVFFGWYPTVKCLVERLGRRAAEWTLKLLSFNAAFFLLWFLLPGVFAELLPEMTGLFWLLWPAGNIVFVLFDLGLSQLLGFYIRTILSKIKK